MNKHTIEYLYTDFKSVDNYSLDYAIDFFAKNAIFLNDISFLKDETELNLYIELSWQQLHILFVKNRYPETFKKSSSYLILIDSEIDRLNVRSARNDWYFGILLFKGMASFRLRDYKTSSSIFERLTIQDNNNENYKNWLNQSIYLKKRWISKKITLVCFCLLLTEIVFNKYITSRILKTVILGIILTGSIGTLYFDYYLKRVFKNNSK